jgi:hypothetical protein
MSKSVFTIEGHLANPDEARDDPGPPVYIHIPRIADSIRCVFRMASYVS